MKKRFKSQIVSSTDAAIQAANLKSIWSQESFLTLRTMIYCATLLEKIAGQPKKKPRPRSAWQQFLSIELKAGSTIQQAAVKWKQKKAA